MPPNQKVMLKVRLVLGVYLRQKREELSLSQDDVATKSGLTKAQVSDAENGKTNFTIETLIALTKAMGVDLMKQLNAKP